MIQHPNPTPALDLLTKVVDYMMRECRWPAERIHLFGFAQGGSVAAEFGLGWWKSHQAVDPTTSHQALGSIVSISGPLLSYPTIERLCPTPVFVEHRKPPSEPSIPRSALTALKKAYQRVQDRLLDGRGSGMPSSREEWEPIMRFWSETLSKRQTSGLYEVLSGAAAQ